MLPKSYTIKELSENDSDLDEVICALQMSIPYPVSDGIKRKAIRKYLTNIKSDTLVVVEDEYVDKIYRNTYSNFLSTKLNRYQERCMRLSLLAPGTDIATLISGTIEEKVLSTQYWGFIILRPIWPGIVGRSAISPKALVNHDKIEISMTPIRSSICGLKVIVEAFPHSSQDAEYSTCAETSIWSLMEYFGNKYPEYTPIMPSQIHELLESQTFQRHVPSVGLRYSDISYVLRSKGFGCKVYSLEKQKIPGFSKEVLYRIFSTYVESGIPMVTAVSGDKGLGHAVVCVGQEIISRDEISKAPVHTLSKSKKHYRLWSDVKRKFVFNDDNRCSYAVDDFYVPTPQYVEKAPYISSIIVPLYKKIYLDAARAIPAAINLCDDIFMKIPEDFIVRPFLASGRSYRNFLMRSSKVCEDFKKYLLQTVEMSKIIWVIEISSTYDNFVNNVVDGLILLDATEPMKKIPAFPLLMSFKKNIWIFSFCEGKFKKNSLSLHFVTEPFSNLNRF